MTLGDFDRFHSFSPAYIVILSSLQRVSYSNAYIAILSSGNDLLITSLGVDTWIQLPRLKNLTINATLEVGSQITTLRQKHVTAP
jgi:hypothetical protein